MPKLTHPNKELDHTTVIGDDGRHYKLENRDEPAVLPDEAGPGGIAAAMRAGWVSVDGQGVPPSHETVPGPQDTTANPDLKPSAELQAAEKAAHGDEPAPEGDEAAPASDSAPAPEGEAAAAPTSDLPTCGLCEKPMTDDQPTVEEDEVGRVHLDCTK